MVFTGNATPLLAAEIASTSDITLRAADVGRFSDGEVTVEIKQTCAHATFSWCSHLRADQRKPDGTC